MPQLSMATRVTAATDRNNYQNIVAPAAGDRLEVHRIEVDKISELAGGSVIRFRFGTSGTQFGARQLLSSVLAKAPQLIDFGAHPQEGPFFLLGGVGEALRMQVMDASGASDSCPNDIHVTVYYRIRPS